MKPTTGTEKPPRRFRVWADVRAEEQIVEVSADATEKECQEACQDAIDVLIANGDTGWVEL